MAITIIKDYSLPFAKNDDYIYLSSDKTNESQFRYGMHLLYNKTTTFGTQDNTTIADGYINVNSNDLDIEEFNKNTLVYLEILSSFSDYFNPVPLLLTNIIDNGSNNYTLYFNKDKLINDSAWYYHALSVALSSTLFDLYKCITKKVAANNDNYGVFSVNDINRELLDNNIIDEDANDVSIKFRYLPFEEYLVKLSYDETTTTSTSINQFKVNSYSIVNDRLSFYIGDDVTVEGDANSFYNGTQKCNSVLFSGSDILINTNKPALNGVSSSGGFAYRADYAATPLTDETLISSEKTAYFTGLKYKDISGLSNTDLNNLITSYTDGSKYFSYAPKEQGTYLNDLGYLTLANNGALVVTYVVTDSANVEHTYTLNLSNSEDVYKVVSNPASINNTSMTTTAARGLPVIQECDKSYTINTNYGTEEYKFNLLKDNKFQRVRLLFSDMLGSLNGFNFALYNAIEITTTKDTYTKDYVDYSSLNTIKYNNQSRAKTDLATKKSYTLTLNSDFLTQDEGNYFEDLLTSNNVFAQYKGDIIAVNIPDTGVTIKEKINGLIRYSIRVEYSINTTQW
jgi:hypothetical protein